MLGGTRYVVRVPGKDTSLLGIDRVAERDANQRAAELGVAPPVAAMLEDPQCLVTEFIEGREMGSEELREPEVMARVAAALRKVHDSPGAVPTSFDSFRVVEEYADTASQRGVEVPAAYSDAHRQAAEIEAVLTGPEHDPVPCHNDLLAANFLDDGEQIWIVDWEYAGMGNRYFDLANFAINNELSKEQHLELLEGYFGEPPSDAQYAAMRLMMFMSDFREAMWGVVQSGVSDLDVDFDEYATKHFERMRETAAEASFEQHLGEARDG
ncbi:MAG: phosphotransferase [Actinomycetota bacterium]|nr:phosphotransferase [Actinomycetota bacterium]